MIPKPSKKPFGYPLPAEALLFLTHPLPGHDFARPFADAGGNVVAWNGALAVRIRSALPADIELDPRPWEAVENSLHWPDPDGEEDPKVWRNLDDAAGLIWKFPPRPAWHQTWDHGRRGLVGNTLATVRVGAATIVPLALLQLCARLPRCRVRTDLDLGSHLPFRWNGGEAVIRPIRDLALPRFGILGPRLTRNF